MEQIKDIVSSVIAAMANGRPEIQNKIRAIWEKAWDAKTLKHTSISGLEKGRLLVHVDSPAWLFQMNLKKREVLGKLKSEIPELSHIHFKIGKVK